MSRTILRARPFCDDGDDGAKQFREISLAEINTEVYGYGDWAHRQCGFILWDSSRLHAMGAFDLTRLQAIRDQLSYKPGDDETHSWLARRDIYNAGGRGWWDKDDSSRVKWLD